MSVIFYIQLDLRETEGRKKGGVRGVGGEERKGRGGGGGRDGGHGKERAEIISFRA